MITSAMGFRLQQATDSLSRCNVSPIIIDNHVISSVSATLCSNPMGIQHHIHVFEYPLQAPLNHNSHHHFIKSIFPAFPQRLNFFHAEHKWGEKPMISKFDRLKKKWHFQYPTTTISSYS